MIVDERMVTYINSLDEGHTPFLEELERQARRDYVPIIRREMQSFKIPSGGSKTTEDSGSGNRSGIFCTADV